MASLKALRGRIKSVKNTQQITKTMKMVAAAKVRRARNAVDSARPYAQQLNQVLVNLACHAGKNGPLLLTGRAETKTVRIIVFGSDRGLCGGFNGNLMKKLHHRVREWQAIGVTIQIVAVGRKIRDAVRREYPSMLYDSVLDFSRNINFALAETIATKALNDFEQGVCDEVQVIYSECKSMINQKPVMLPLMPFAASDEARKHVNANASVDYEPSEEVILSVLLPKNVKTQIFQALLESAASEHAARMSAMDNATRNAGDMIKRLSLQYNRSRQAAITTELTEIISGAEAL